MGKGIVRVFSREQDDELVCVYDETVGVVMSQFKGALERLGTGKHPYRYFIAVNDFWVDKIGLELLGVPGNVEGVWRISTQSDEKQRYIKQLLRDGYTGSMVKVDVDTGQVTWGTPPSPSSGRTKSKRTTKPTCTCRRK